MTDQAAEKPNPYAKCKPGDEVGDLVTRGKLPRVWDGEQWISLLDGLNQSLVEINEIAKRHYTKRFDSLVGCPAEYSESISVWKGSSLVVLDMRNFENHRFELFIAFDSIREARAQIREIIDEIRMNRF